MQIELNESKITVTDHGIITDGIYYTYLNGYMNKQSRRHFINKNDLLLAKVVRDRSKKIMFAFVAIGIVFVWIYKWLYNTIGALFNVNSFSDFENQVEQIGQYVDYIAEEISSPSFLFYLIMAVIIAVIIASYGFLIYYVFTNRKYLELTFIGGCIRARCKDIPPEQLNRITAEINRITSQQ